VFVRTSRKCYRYLTCGLLIRATLKGVNKHFPLCRGRNGALRGCVSVGNGVHVILIDSWSSELSEPILAAVHRILLTVLSLFIAAQLLLAVPAGAGAMSGASSAAAHCADMHEASGEKHCPCCPDGADSMSDCMSACIAAAALPASLPVFAVDRLDEFVRRPSFDFVTSLADPPLKPPPIV
jgi:hypothetical protein